MNHDGRGATRVTSEGGSPTHPTWSADGQSIAFEATDPESGGREIYLVTVADGAIQRLTSGACKPSDGRSCPDGEVGNRQPAFSPDGSQIAFVRTDKTGRHLYLMSADGSGQRSLTKHPGQDNHAAWSPDGKRLAFISNRGGGYDVYVMDVKE